MLLGCLTTLLVIFMLSSCQDTVNVLRILSTVLNDRYGPSFILLVMVLILLILMLMLILMLKLMRFLKI